MFGLQIIDIATIIAYFVVVILIGIWASRRIKSQEDYFLDGRRFGKFVQTFASFGQGTSAESAVGTTVFVARNGVAGIWVNLVWVFQVWMYWITSIWYRRMRLLTLGDFFEERYNSKGLPALYSLISSVFFMIVIGLGFTAMTRTVAAIANKPAEKLSVMEKVEYDLAIELQQLEEIDSRILTSEQQTRLDRLRLENPRKDFSYVNENILMMLVAAVVVIYAILGGLEAAFLTDTLQSLFTLILALLLLPFACVKINAVFGGSGITGIVEATRSRLPEAAFEVWGSPAMVDFTWYYIIAILIMGSINVAVQANQLVACGSAKDEYTARFGFTTGVFIKRCATFIWGVSALLLVVLYSNVVKNPDYMYGYAVRDLLGAFGMGLVGLMIACLMAALMSMVDCLMLTASSLMTHNFFRPLFPNLSEKGYIWVGRIFGFLIVACGVLMASLFQNVFQMIKLIWEFNIVMAAVFWLGLKWRRATRTAAWCSFGGAVVFFVILQVFIPMIPGVKTNDYLLKTIEPISITRSYTARQVDVEKHNEEIAKWDSLDAVGKAEGSRPEPLIEGQKFDKTYNTPKKAIFWTQGLVVDDDGMVKGKGMLTLELIALDKLGFDLSKNPYALNETIRISIRTVVPFLILVVVSWLTKPVDKHRLDRFFVKMKTPVQADREIDAKEMALSYENPQRFDHMKMFRNSNWEFEKLDRTDIKGIVWCTIGGLIVFAVFCALFTIGG